MKKEKYNSKRGKGNEEFRHITVFYHFDGSQDSVVSIMTMVQDGWSGFKSWQGQESFLFSKMTRPFLEPIQSPVQQVPEFFSGVQQMGHQVDHSPSASTDIKNGAIPLLPMHIFTVWTGTTLPLHPSLSLGYLQYSIILQNNQLPSNVVGLKGERTLLLYLNPVKVKCRSKASVRSEAG